MFLQKKIMPLTKGYWDNINHVAQRIKEADRIILGIGSGLSAAGGLDYMSHDLACRWFPEYVAAGLGSIVEIQSLFWWQSRCKLERYWGYWARHIWHIRYESPVTQPYLDLMELVKDKEYFAVTTNADGQVQKAGFPKEKVFAPQGDYQYFQCSKPCSQDIYDNREMVERMAKRFPDAHLARVNLTRPEIPHEIVGKGTAIQRDLGKARRDLLSF